MRKKLKRLIKRLLSGMSGDAKMKKKEIVIEMTELEQTLRNSYDWASDRVGTLMSQNRHHDADAIMCEFHEWFDPSIEDYDIFSVNYLGEAK